ncbi:phytoene desaturase family protein [Brevibacterium daeguense]|uniref:Phytoene desaturase family protein n=1 Tax=Brevibacterium daeguense TaxID=909936 RepID=A0ABP8EK94_9MICO|nr:phytoene desaturase family protein [Brevibacterium daeguense]
MSRAVVIGAGIAGMATATLLAHEGHEVTVLERNDWLGGRAGSHREAGFTFDTGPSWYLMPEVFDHFFRLCGTSAAEQLELVTLDPAYRVFAEDGRVADVPLGRERVRELFESLEPGCGPRLDAYLDSASKTYDIALRHLLYSTFDSPAALAHPDVLGNIGPLAGMLTSSLAERIEGTVTHPLLRQILGYPAVFLAMSPDRASAIYHLMSRLDLIDGVQYPMGGMYTVISAIERCARAAGVEFRTGAEVVALPVDRARGRAARPGTVSEVVARTSAGLEVLPADLVVAACDLHHVETTLVEPGFRTTDSAAWTRRDPGMGGVVMMLGIDRRLDSLAHHNLFLTTDWDANFGAIFGDDRSLPDPASVYVCAPSRTDPGVAPDGCENVFVLVPSPADPSLRSGQVEFEAYCDRIVEQLAAWAGEPDLAEHIVVRRTLGPGDYVDDFHAWQGTILGPANTLRQSVFFRDGARSAKIGNLYRAGAFTAPGVGLPMCLISAENVVKALRGDTSGGWLDAVGAGTAPEPR